jgi:hypothetical protein
MSAVLALLKVVCKLERGKTVWFRLRSDGLYGWDLMLLAWCV